MSRIMSIFGTRPEAIKMAPIVARLQRTPNVESVVCVTGQHRQMLDRMCELFGLAPDVDLDLMKPGQRPVDVLCAAVGELAPIIRDASPDVILVQGDTTTAMAAALAGAYEGAAIGHVEAGLRTFDKRQPFPEELNRLVVAACGDLHFAPTASSATNLIREGHDPKTVWITGNTVIDALLDVHARPFEPPPGDPLAEVPWDRDVILVTAHRRENFGQPMRDALGAIAEIQKRSAGSAHVVYPVHPNPEVRAAVDDTLAGLDGITLLPPLDYQRLVHVMGRARLIITDSGGIQEEAPALGKPVLVLRDVTERPEAVDFGTVKLVGCDPERIIHETIRLLEDPSAYALMAERTNPYGDGRAAERITAALTGAHVEEFCPDGDADADLDAPTETAPDTQATGARG